MYATRPSSVSAQPRTGRRSAGAALLATKSRTGSGNPRSLSSWDRASATRAPMLNP
ncbi:hypothetical protein H4W33_001143 [Kibdelosporangium phytohabitans]|nr:hypothetical protein [Kibdelosporangium phytohabitans]MBE1462131.1 hypothetical protein [Kibdelosporangium phytohabitans]